MTVSVIELDPAGTLSADESTGLDEAALGSDTRETSVVSEIRFPAARFVEDELVSVIETACLKFPQRDKAEVATLVAEAHRHLAEHASVTAHLIPLTLNRSLRILRGSP